MFSVKEVSSGPFSDTNNNFFKKLKGWFLLLEDEGQFIILEDKNPTLISIVEYFLYNNDNAPIISRN